MAESKTPELEINLNPPTSPLVSFNIRSFIKNINVPVDMKTETNTNTNDIQTGGGGTGGFFDYFKSFFQGISQQNLQKKKHDTQNKSYLNSLFYSGKTPENKEESVAEPVKESVAEPVKESVAEPVKESVAEPVKEKEKEEPVEEESSDNLEITKIILTTMENPEIVLRESLKGTKLFYLAERNGLPSQWV